MLHITLVPITNVTQPSGSHNSCVTYPSDPHYMAYIDLWSLLQMLLNLPVSITRVLHNPMVPQTRVLFSPLVFITRVLHGSLFPITRVLHIHLVPFTSVT